MLLIAVLMICFQPECCFKDLGCWVLFNSFTMAVCYFHCIRFLLSELHWETAYNIFKLIKLCSVSLQVRLTQLNIPNPYRLFCFLQDFLKINPSKSTWKASDEDCHKAHKLGSRWKFFCGPHLWFSWPLKETSKVQASTCNPYNVTEQNEIFCLLLTKR